MEDKIILNDIVRWWEKKRFWYNIVVGIIGFFFIFNITGAPNLYEILAILIWGLGANIFYSVGILLEVFDQYYLKGKLKLRSFRMAFFIFGLLVSCCVTIINILLSYNRLIIG